ncbi:eukaryotic initiation factor 4A [Trichinella spiralis]|uniref:eukaryotic initiation factor 4A n=1 Tax=Trichinella spiralis TaxID=6334 RepID=UPI0001EFC749|nr:eukaryotic initiation factor 4A [Trichinella spiralis]
MEEHEPGKPRRPQIKNGTIEHWIPPLRRSTRTHRKQKYIIMFEDTGSTVKTADSQLMREGVCARALGTSILSTKYVKIVCSRSTQKPPLDMSPNLTSLKARKISMAVVAMNYIRCRKPSTGYHCNASYLTNFGNFLMATLLKFKAWLTLQLSHAFN